MVDVAATDPEGGGRRFRKVLPVALTVLSLGGGGAIGYFGLWSPQGLLVRPADSATDFTHEFVFVDIPSIVLALPGSKSQSLIFSIKIEARPEHVAQITYLQPRILDALNTFLSEIDSRAFERRGVLEVIRSELATRMAFVLGQGAFNDILITEFRIQ